MIEISDDKIALWKVHIDGMNARECLELQRFAPSGHPVFRSDLPLYDYFRKHFDALGGITPELSKSVGWT
jgi:hypothetical protein